jgi:hypothetical protein
MHQDLHTDKFQFFASCLMGLSDYGCLSAGLASVKLQSCNLQQQVPSKHQ